MNETTLVPPTTPEERSRLTAYICYTPFLRALFQPPCRNLEVICTPLASPTLYSISVLSFVRPLVVTQIFDRERRNFNWYELDYPYQGRTGGIVWSTYGTSDPSDFERVFSYNLAYGLDREEWLPTHPLLQPSLDGYLSIQLVRPIRARDV